MMHHIKEKAIHPFMSLVPVKVSNDTPNIEKAIHPFMSLVLGLVCYSEAIVFYYMLLVLGQHHLNVSRLLCIHITSA